MNRTHEQMQKPPYDRESRVKSINSVITIFNNPYILVIAAIILAILVFLYWHILLSYGFEMSVFIAAMLAISLRDRKTNRKGAWNFARVLTLSVIVPFGFYYIYCIFGWVQNPPEWDFLSFRMYGKVAAQGFNFYNPSFFKDVIGDLPVGEDFRNQTINYAFPYPPPTMFLFVILGFLNLRSAAILWYLVNFLFLIGCTFLIWLRYLRAKEIQGLGIALAFLLLLRPSFTTLHSGQTIFIVLFLFLLGLRDTSSKWTGVWWGLASVVKPFMAVLLIPLVMRKNWKSILAFLFLWSSLLFLACVAFGFDTCLSYFTLNPAGKRPSWIFSEPANQSLLATIIRLTDNATYTGSPMMNPIYWTISSCLCVISLLTILKKNAVRNDASFLVFLLFGLMVYPGTLSFYSVLLIVVLFELLFVVSSLRRRDWIGICIVTVLYTLTNLEGGKLSFWAYLLAWLTFLCIVLAGPNDGSKIVVLDRST